MDLSSGFSVRNRDGDVEVSGRSAEAARLAVAGDPDLVAVVQPGRNVDPEDGRLCGRSLGARNRPPEAEGNFSSLRGAGRVEVEPEPEVAPLGGRCAFA